MINGLIEGSLDESITGWIDRLVVSLSAEWMACLFDSCIALLTVLLTTISFLGSPKIDFGIIGCPFEVLRN